MKNYELIENTKKNKNLIHADYVFNKHTHQKTNNAIFEDVLIERVMHGASLIHLMSYFLKTREHETNAKI
jgi:DNA integrity scanning protein DisA with diadenylate cyclase activity